jgi:hypothetical protein
VTAEERRKNQRYWNDLLVIQEVKGTSVLVPEAMAVADEKEALHTVTNLLLSRF